MPKKLVAVSAVAVILLLGFSFLVFPENDRKKKDEMYKNLELFSDALVLVQKEYVDEPKTEVLIQGAIRGMLGSLDNYSEFLDAEGYKELKINTEGRFGGLGIEIAIKDGILTVISPIEDTPAWKAGVKAGDRIAKINGELTKNITITDAVKKLRGMPGTEVTLTILREGQERLLEIKLIRDIIKIKDIKDARILEDNIGYIRLVEFREDTPRDLDLVLARLKSEGMDSLILDLRNNPGGLLDIAVKVVEKFIPEGKLIVYTKGRNPAQDMEFKSRPGYARYSEIPMVLLVNEGSASGSEIVAGALQDYRRAVILGNKTFGKGLVQSVLPLSGGSALKLTTSKYFTPSGRVINNLGINPDIVVKAARLELVAEDSEIKDIFLDIEKDNKQREKKPSSGKPEPILEYQKDNQIVQAIGVIKGIKVYKGMVADNARKK